MESLLEENKVLIKTLSTIKNKMIDINAAKVNGGGANVMSQIVSLKEVNDELKTLLILLHTNKTTEVMHTQTNLVKIHLEVIDILDAVLRRQTVLIDKLKPKPKRFNLGLLFKNTKVMLLIITLVGVLLVWVLNTLDTTATHTTIEQIKSLIG